MLFFWLTTVLFFLLLEIGSPGFFFFLSFSFGAFVIALISMVVHVSFMMQCVIFLIGTVLGFIGLNCWLKGEKSIHYVTNVYALKGKRGIVIKDIISYSVGLVKINGETWSARSVQNKAISKGIHVKIVAIRGSHLVVDTIKSLPK